MGGKHNKACCEAVDCRIGEDDFDRSDSTSLGSKWVEKSGDFAIDDQTLITNSPGVVLTSYRQSNPRGNGYHYQVIVEFVVSTATEWGMICKYEDENNFDWIHFYVEDENVYPEFYRRAGGSDTLIMDRTTHPAGIPFPLSGDANIQVEMCYSEVGWTVESGPEMARWTTCDVSVASSLPGDGTVGLVGFMYGDFDNFVYNHHRLSNLPCPVCDCLCENPLDLSDYRCMPEAMVMTIHPIAPFTDPYGGCDPGGDLVLNLYQSLPTGLAPTVTPTYDASPRKLEWYSDVIEFPDRSVEMWFLFECINGEFRMHQLLYPGDFPTNSSGSGIVEWLGTPFGTYQVGTIVSCDPLVVHFETLRVENHDDGVGAAYCDTLPDLDYEITVTE